MKTLITAAVITLGIASSASAMCGPQVSFNANKSANDVIGTNITNGDTVGVAEYGDTFNFSNNNGNTTNNTRGLTFGVSLSFSLDGGRACEEQDLRIATARDNAMRAAHQAEMQRQQQAASLINNLIAGIQYCETADLAIPANVNFCKDYLAN